MLILELVILGCIGFTAVTIYDIALQLLKGE
jgi:hypothetical protein